MSVAREEHAINRCPLHGASDADGGVAWKTVDPAFMRGSAPGGYRVAALCQGNIARFQTSASLNAATAGGATRSFPGIGTTHVQ